MNCNKCGKEIANIQTASCTNFVCKKCGSTEYEIKDKSNGTGIAHGLYCAKCGFWHKWLGQEELKQYATKESKDEIIAKLQSENAALRERLEKAVELPCKIGDRFYIVEYYPPEIIEEECCDFSFREFPKILLENGCDCTYELGDNGSYFVTFDKNEAKKIFEKLKKEQRND